MSRPKDITVKAGEAIPALEFGPITRHTLALYCGGSGDHNPIHVDSDFAKASGYDDVFAHGMLSMAIQGRQLTDWTEQANISSFSVRFSNITQVLDEITACATVKEISTVDDQQRLVLETETLTQTGTKTLVGRAEVVVKNSLEE